MIKTMDKISEKLNSKPFMIVAGICLIISFIEHYGYLWGSDFEFAVDPAWLTVAISGIPLAWLAIYRVIKEKFVSSALLITVAMVACLSIDEIFAAGEVAFIMQLGAWLEEKAVDRTRKGLEKLIALTPLQGRRITKKPDGSVTQEMVKVEELRIDDILRILPGETVPSDAVVVSGNTSIDQSIMTGESLPVDKAEGDEVFSGTINRYGTADIKITKTMENSSLQKMISLVKEAENNKAPMQKIVDKVAVWLVPIAILIAIGGYFLTGDYVRAVTILVVFCPCALALATPTSVVAAIGQATKHGILIKSGEALEKMGQVNAIAFDKTGTLTYGKLVVSDVILAEGSGLKEEDVLAIAAAVESRSEHPIGKAMVNGAKEKNLEIQEVEDFTMTVGKGVMAIINKEPVYVGSIKYLQENNIVVNEVELNIMAELQGQGKAANLVAQNGKCLGIVALSDVYREDAPAMIQNLSSSGITKSILLTGDNKRTAEYIAARVGLTDIKAELLPANKVDAIKEIQNSGYKVCMVGDGVNDAPALKTAHVGIAMASMGSDIAIEAADIALLGDDIGKVPYIKRLSNTCVNTIKFNITLSMLINAVAIVLSVLGMLTPITGALWHNVGSVAVTLNAALLYDRKIYEKTKREEAKVVKLTGAAVNTISK